MKVKLALSTRLDLSQLRAEGEAACVSSKEVVAGGGSQLSRALRRDETVGNASCQVSLIYCCS